MEIQIESPHIVRQLTFFHSWALLRSEGIENTWKIGKTWNSYQTSATEKVFYLLLWNFISKSCMKYVIFSIYSMVAVDRHPHKSTTNLHLLFSDGQDHRHEKIIESSQPLPAVHCMTSVPKLKWHLFKISVGLNIFIFMIRSCNFFINPNIWN